jgi:YesN/AraC family two-component response regulator
MLPCRRGRHQIRFSVDQLPPFATLITAENGVVGLDAFAKRIPDIVVTDILMPQMDGLAMSEKILEMVPSLPIIVVTAFEQTDYLMRAINMGIEKYVTKPVNSYLLFETLLECAHRLRAEQQLKLQHQQEIRDAWSKQNETIAILAGGIAHDYNNLMQAILVYPGSEKSVVGKCCRVIL